MKFRRPTARERAQQRERKFEAWVRKSSQWHKWVAWWPVRLTSDEHAVIWMSNIYRKLTVQNLNSRAEENFKWLYAESTLDILKIDEKHRG